MTSTPPPASRYNRINFSGQSIFSDVYRTIDTQTNEVVALKVTIPDELRPPHDSLREVEILRRLQAERERRGLTRGATGVIEMIKAWTEDGDVVGEVVLSVVLPFLGHDLNSVLEMYRHYPSRPESPVDHEDLEDTEGNEAEYKNVLPASRARAILYQLASALEFVHSQGIIHRDVKPHNILFESLDSDCKLTLVDFDISWIAPDNLGREPANDKITDVGSGTYRAPEVLFGIGSYDTSIDIWSLGVVAVQLFSANSNRHPIFYNEGSKYSDIALIGTIFKLLGVPTAESWPEVRDVPSFQHMAFKTDRDPATWAELAPLAPESFQNEVLPRLLCYSGAKRLTAREILDSSYFKNGTSSSKN